MDHCHELYPVVENRPVIQQPVFTQKIPNIIHQTFIWNMVPKERRKAMETILTQNGDYSYRYYNDDKCRRYLSTYFSSKILEAYDSLIPGAYKADLFRYCVLYKEGGVYIDSTFICLVPLREIIDPENTFVTAIDSDEGLYNAIICSTPYNSILEKAIELCLERITNREYGHSNLYPTGPLVLGKAFKDITKIDLFKEGRYHKDIKLLSRNESKENLGGVISFKGVELFYTKYPSVLSENDWYVRRPVYGEYWNTGNIYR